MGDLEAAGFALAELAAEAFEGFLEERAAYPQDRASIWLSTANFSPVLTVESIM
jgi:hypothetical protein